MSAETFPSTMHSPPTTNGTRVIPIHGRPVDRNRRGVLAFLALLMVIAGGICLGVGLSLTCHSSYCDYRSYIFIVSGSCLLLFAVILLVGALVLHNRIRTTIRLNQSSAAQQPVIVSPGYPGQPAIAFAILPTQYPPPYHPPTGPFPYSLSPADNQYPPPAGFTANSQPTESYPQEATKPPPYSP